MRFLRTFALFLIVTSTCIAQEPISATTELGRKVILHPDGSWKYVETPPAERSDQMSNPRKKPAKATDVISLNKGKCSVSFNPEIWYRNPGADPGRPSLKHKNGDGYAVIIPERIEVPVTSLKEVVVKNLKDKASEVNVVKEERRLVNGNEVLFLQIDAVLKGISFVYVFHVYSGPAGSVQILAYTGKNLLSEFNEDFQDFLDGFEVAPQK